MMVKVTKRNKRKLRKLRTLKYRGGGKDQELEFIRLIQTNDQLSDVKNISPTKIVATSKSVTIRGEESINDKIIRLWNRELTEADKESIKRKFMSKFGYTLGVYIPRGEGGNSVVFYAEEYLELLAVAAEKTPAQVLRILGSGGEKTQNEMDIIKVAFGDKFMPAENGYALSPSGEALFEVYMATFESIAR